MEKVTRYQCEYCKKEFRTPDRHNCKYDPKNKNCHSCKHNKGWVKEDIEYGYEIVPNCDKGYGDINALELSDMGYKLDCCKYEYRREV